MNRMTLKWQREKKKEEEEEQTEGMTTKSQRTEKADLSEVSVSKTGKGNKIENMRLQNLLKKSGQLKKRMEMKN